MEQVWDLFLHNDAFSVTSLERVVENAPFVPDMLGQMQIFEPRPIDTENLMIYEEDGAFRIIPTTQRGASPVMQQRNQGRFFGLKTVRLAKQDTVRASELMGIAAMPLGSPNQVRSAQQLVSDRTNQLKQDLEGTKEFHRLGALQGKLYDADGTTLIADYFSEFNISQPAAIVVDFDNLAQNELGDFFEYNMFKPMTLALKNRFRPGMRMGALVGDNFWRKLTRHPAIQRIYELQQMARYTPLNQAPQLATQVWGTLQFGSIEFINYRGSTGGEIAIGANDAIFFPIGARDVFRAYWSPGETFDELGLGKPEYLKIEPDPKVHKSYMDIIVSAYPLYACIFPKALLRATLP